MTTTTTPGAGGCGCPDGDPRPDASPGTRQDTYPDAGHRDCRDTEPVCDPPRTLTRNRFFPRKLMEVRHWRAEQAYHRHSRELVTRLGLGSGVLCGLDTVLTDDDTLLILPGVAVDGLGRPVVVPGDVEIDPRQLTDDCGRPSGDPIQEGTVTVVLCYHECGSDPVPLPGTSCDGRVECVPSMTREAYAVLVRPGAATRHGLPSGLCEALCPEPGQSSGNAQPAVDGDQLRALLDQLDPRGCGCEEICVPLCTVTVSAGRPATPTTTVRTVLRSNRELLDLLMCLADRQRDCCRALPPRIVGLWPWPSDDGTGYADLASSGRLELAFDRDLAEQGLDDPSTWLGLWVIGQQEVTRLRISRSSASPQHVPVDSGDVAVYTVDALDVEALEAGAVALVMARSVARGPIVAAGPDAAALDTDLPGTPLPLGRRDLLWKVAPGVTAGDTGVTPDDLRAPRAWLPTGDGREGGDLHVAYQRPPQLLSVWPPGNSNLVKNATNDQDSADFFAQPRLRLVVSRPLADAALAAPHLWIRLWQFDENAAGLSDGQELPLGQVATLSLHNGTVQYTLPVTVPGGWPPPAARLLVQVYSGPAVGPGSPVSRDEPALLLDADFTGTDLDPNQQLWQLWSNQKVSDLPNYTMYSTTNQDLRDGTAGGFVHWGFRVTNYIVN
jgi:hypothetical protein